MRRRDGGAPLREAMHAAGLSVRTLAAATKEADPEGKGVGAATIGRVTSEAASGRDTMRAGAAELIATALRTPLHVLFDDDASSPAPVSTISPKQRTPLPPGVEGMVDAKTLAAFLSKHPKWVWDQPAEHPKGSATPFPVHYVGTAPRYFISEVMAWLPLAFPQGVAA